LPFLADDDELFRVKNGTQQVIDRLAERNRALIHPGNQVIRVESEDQIHYTVTVQTPQGIQKIETDHPIFAMPKYALRKIDWRVKGFPAKSMLAIRQTTFGSHGKLVMYFKDRPWLRFKHTGEMLLDLGAGLPALQLWESSQGQTVPSGSLTAFGRIPENTDPEKLATKILATLEKIFPGISQTYLGSRLISWPNSYTGAYQPGERTKASAVTRPVGSLHFVGEDVSANQFGYMEGALETADAAASAVIQSPARPEPLNCIKPLLLKEFQN
jgi:monoamine oxidase